MRAILVDWMSEVALAYSLSMQTLFLSVNYLDRYLATTNVRVPTLQLVGVATMLIASYGLVLLNLPNLSLKPP